MRPGFVLRSLIGSMNGRVASGDKIRMGSFDSLVDSSGKNWVSWWSGDVTNGMNLLEVAREMANDGVAEARFMWDKVELFDLAAEANPVTVAEFAVGKNMLDGPTQNSVSGLVTAVLVTSQPPTPEGAETEPDSLCGWVWSPPMVAKWGVIEGYKNAESLSTYAGLRQHGENYLREQARLKSQDTFGFEPRVEDGTIPYRQINLGDWVSVDTDGVPEAKKIKVITLSWDENRNLKAGLTCNDRFYEYDMARYKRTLIR